MKHNLFWFSSDLKKSIFLGSFKNLKTAKLERCFIEKSMIENETIEMKNSYHFIFSEDGSVVLWELFKA